MVMEPSFRTIKIRATDVVVFLVVVAVRLGYFGLTHITYEDSLITLRYAQNLASGHGLVYNPGERLFGASTPLYVLLLSLLCWLRASEPLLAARLILVAADGLTAVLWCRLLGRETRSWHAPALFAVAFGLSPFLVQNSVSGMETSLALLFLTAAFVADREDRVGLLGACLGLLALVRPDGLVAWVVILGVRAIRERRLPWRAALVAALVVLPWVLFAWVYFGTPVPNSLFAKAAAYNAHIQGIRRNLLYTLNQFAPVGAESLPHRLFNAVIAAFVPLGVWSDAREHRRLLGIPLFWLAWWAFLVLPRTLLFLWYYPPLTMTAYALAGLGFAFAIRRVPAAFRGRSTEPVEGVRRRSPHLGPDLAAAAVVVYLGIAALPWLWLTQARTAAVQAAEEQVRRPAGEWLARNSLEDATVAMEPIGYIGYYSRRRVLDEVGLVSPQMIPFTRAGAGWFGRAMRAFRPDYVVERPYFLQENLTINTHVPMFATDEDRAWFEANYVPVKEFPGRGRTLHLPDKLDRDYHFVIFQRR